MIAILAARAVGYQGNAHVSIAALIEFIHTATLLHDDVVDESDMRRGKATANAAFATLPAFWWGILFIPAPSR